MTSKESAAPPPYREVYPESTGTCYRITTSCAGAVPSFDKGDIIKEELC